MDARQLFPQGHHPVILPHTPDNIYDAIPLSRMDHPVQYLFIDFGISHRFEEGASNKLLGYRGRNQQVPELSTTVPYDAYKVDVYALGDVYAKEFTEVSTALGRSQLSPHSYCPHPEILRSRVSRSSNRSDEATKSHRTTLRARSPPHLPGMQIHSNKPLSSLATTLSNRIYTRTSSLRWGGYSPRRYIPPQTPHQLNIYAFLRCRRILPISQSDVVSDFVLILPVP